MKQLCKNTDLVIRYEAGAQLQFDNRSLGDEVVPGKLCHDGEFFLRDMLFFAELAYAQAADVFSVVVVPESFQCILSLQRVCLICLTSSFC